MATKRLGKRVLSWGLVAAIALGVGLRLGQVGTREYWYDEVLTLLIAAGQQLSYTTPPDTPVALADYGALLELPADIGWIETVKRLLLGLLNTEPHPPLFYLMQHGWLGLSGPAEAATRSLNLTLSGVAIASAYGFGRAFLNHRLGLTLAALLALNPFFFFHSLNARMYAPILLWSLLSGWSVVQLLQPDGKPRWRWGLMAAAAMAAGLLTSYLFVLWVLGAVLTALVLRRWAVLGAAAAGAAATLPWGLWGMGRQLRSADLSRFNSEGGALAQLLDHLRGALETLGVHLLWGDWGTVLPGWLLGLSGLGLLGALGGGLLWLGRRGEGRRAVMAAGLGLLPFGLALAADMVTGKSTLPWGLGRSVIFALPGLLLGLAWGLQALPRRWGGAALALLLVAYGGLSLGDGLGRQRRVFEPAAALVNAEAAGLVLLNSKAWGHVLRAAYYLPGSVQLLATHPADLPAATAAALEAGSYEQVLWLQAQRPVWEAPEAEATEALAAATAAQLGARYELSEVRQLTGTMNLDRFTARLYRRPPSTAVGDVPVLP